jgi:hypothetical protein
MQRWWLVAGLLAAAPAAFAQQAAPPPADLEPGVNTSAMPANTAPTPPAPTSVAPPPATPAVTAPAPKASTTSTKPAKPSGTPSPAAPSNSAGGPKGSGKAEDHLQLDTTSITGNQELPKVLYIVPWKRSDLGDMLGKPANSLLDEVLQPVDRDVFRRQNRYYDALKPDAGGAAGKATGAAVQASGDKR